MALTVEGLKSLLNVQEDGSFATKVENTRGYLTMDGDKVENTGRHLNFSIRKGDAEKNMETRRAVMEAFRSSGLDAAAMRRVYDTLGISEDGVAGQQAGRPLERRVVKQLMADVICARPATKDINASVNYVDDASDNLSRVLASQYCSEHHLDPEDPDRDAIDTSIQDIFSSAAQIFRDVVSGDLPKAGAVTHFVSLEESRQSNDAERDKVLSHKDHMEFVQKASRFLVNVLNNESAVVDVADKARTHEMKLVTNIVDDHIGLIVATFEQKSGMHLDENDHHVLSDLVKDNMGLSSENRKALLNASLDDQREILVNIVETRTDLIKAALGV